MKIVIITPTRNEEKYLETTINCMLRQTVLPAKWVIVNDGSSDNTGAIVRRSCTDDHPFIEYVSRPDRGFRKPGRGVVEAFYEGLSRAEGTDYDVVAKFDADLDFPPDMLEQICRAFQNDPLLGITGGTQYEQADNRGPFRKIYIPAGYVTGPTKFYRRQCFEDIGGLIHRAGWDGVDIIRAKMKGWKTGVIDSLPVLHLKTTGSAAGEGKRKACEKYGDVSYYMGGALWYFVLRMLGRSLEDRDPQVGFYMLKGYLKALLRRTEREPKEFRDFLKKTERQRVADLLAKTIPHRTHRRAQTIG